MKQTSIFLIMDKLDLFLEQIYIHVLLRSKIYGACLNTIWFDFVICVKMLFIIEDGITPDNILSASCAVPPEPSFV